MDRRPVRRQRLRHPRHRVERARHLARRLAHLRRRAPRAATPTTSGSSTRCAATARIAAAVDAGYVDRRGDVRVRAPRHAVRARRLGARRRAAARRHLRRRGRRRRHARARPGRGRRADAGLDAARHRHRQPAARQGSRRSASTSTRPSSPSWPTAAATRRSASSPTSGSSSATSPRTCRSRALRMTRAAVGPALPHVPARALRRRSTRSTRGCTRRCASTSTGRGPSGTAWWRTMRAGRRRGRDDGAGRAACPTWCSPPTPGIVVTGDGVRAVATSAIRSASPRRGSSSAWFDATRRFAVRRASATSSTTRARGDALLVRPGRAALRLPVPLRCGRRARAVSALSGAPVRSVELVDERLYHLDLTFCPLDDRRAICRADRAGTATAARSSRPSSPSRCGLTDDEALSFCANSVVVDHTIVMPDRARPASAAMLEALGLHGGRVRRRRVPQGRRRLPLPHARPGRPPDRHLARCPRPDPGHGR